MDASLASGRRYYRVNTRGDRQRDGRAASCVHRITHRMTVGQHGSKDVVLIMPSGWIAAAGGVCGSQRCKAKWRYWVVRQRRRQRPLCRLNRLNLARSSEIDHENGYENRSPVFSYRGTSDPLIVTFVLSLWWTKNSIKQKFTCTASVNVRWWHEVCAAVDSAMCHRMRFWPIMFCTFSFVVYMTKFSSKKLSISSLMWSNLMSCNLTM